MFVGLCANMIPKATGILGRLQDLLSFSERIRIMKPFDEAKSRESTLQQQEPSTPPAGSSCQVEAASWPPFVTSCFCYHPISETSPAFLLFSSLFIRAYQTRSFTCSDMFPNPPPSLQHKVPTENSQQTSRTMDPEAIQMACMVRLQLTRSDGKFLGSSVLTLA
jgi:hypothetical protein